MTYIIQYLVAYFYNDINSHEEIRLHNKGSTVYCSIIMCGTIECQSWHPVGIPKECNEWFVSFNFDSLYKNQVQSI